MKQTRHIRGFTLVEMAIVIVTISLLATGAVSLGIVTKEKLRVENTREKIDFIMETVKRFVQFHGYLPCPAGGAVQQTWNGNFGLSADAANGSPSSISCYTADFDVSAAGGHAIWAGAVPVYTLGLSPNMMLDGWNHRMTFVVDRELTSDAGRSSYQANDGQIEIRNIGGNTLLSDAAVVIISHGRNGHGAWPGKGGSRIDKGIAGGTPEEENAHVSGGYNEIFVQGLTRPNYDDILSYRTKWQLEAN